MNGDGGSWQGTCVLIFVFVICEFVAKFELFPNSMDASEEVLSMRRARSRMDPSIPLVSTTSAVSENGLTFLLTLQQSRREPADFPAACMSRL